MSKTMLPDKAAFESIYSTSSQIEAEAIKAYLNSCNIPTEIKSESMGRISGLTLGPLAELSLITPISFSNEARRLLEEYKTQTPVKTAAAEPKPYIRFGYIFVAIFVMIVIALLILRGFRII
jgi:Putative prokaryotic signal transducing protein